MTRWYDAPVIVYVRLTLNAMTIVALTIAVIGLSDITTSRRAAAEDACNLLLGLVRKTETPVTRARAEAYVAATPLHNCAVYARKTVH